MQMDIDRIWTHLSFLAAEPRFAESARLEACRRYCEDALAKAGWQTERRPFTASGDSVTSYHGINVVAQFGQQPSSDDNKRPRFIVGAHLDSKAETPGADDNASAVAVLLELAQVLGDHKPSIVTSGEGVVLELVIFDLEELGMLGGAFHAESCRTAECSLVGMISLEMLGYCDHSPGSQSLPEALQGRYSDVGNFIAVVGNQNSGSLIRHFEASFRSVADLPAESLQVPENGQVLPPTRLSDHSPFWDAGYPALMITDTSFMRNPHYHLPSDTLETLDREFLHKVSEGVLRAVTDIDRLSAQTS
jgi:Zn-dependent M28 family amino/carboxypeptidase